LSALRGEIVEKEFRLTKRGSGIVKIVMGVNKFNTNLSIKKSVNTFCTPAGNYPQLNREFQMLRECDEIVITIINKVRK
jgi:hypothetical protein